MTPLRIVVAPNGVAIAKDAQEVAPSPKLLWTLAPAVAALVRPMLDDPKVPAEVDTHLLHADEAGLVWQVGPWILHGSVLRAPGSLEAFFALVASSRARTSAPLHVLYGVGADEGLPAGFIAQIAGNEAPLPMVTFPLPRDVQNMWLVGCRLGLAARLGEEGLRSALAAVAQSRRAHGDFASAFEPTRRRLAEEHGVTGDEAVAAMILEGWETEGGGAKAVESFLSARADVV